MIGLLAFDRSEAHLALVVYTPEGELAWTQDWGAEEVDDARLSTDGTNFAVAFLEGQTFQIESSYRYFVFEPGGAQRTAGAGGPHHGFRFSVELAGDAVFIGTSHLVPSGSGAGQTSGAQVVAHRRGQQGPVWTWARPGPGTSSVRATRAHPNGSLFVVGSQGGTNAPDWVVRLSSSGEEMWTGEIPWQGPVTGLVVLPSGDVALVREGNATVFDVDGAPVQEFAFSDHVGAVLFDTRDGKFLVEGRTSLGRFAVGLDAMGTVEFELRDEAFQPTAAAWIDDDVVVAGLSTDRESIRVSRMLVPPM